MKVDSIHARDLDASPEQVGALLTRLGAPGDELWPHERWPTTPIEFDRPLAVGARGGHGLIRYTVVEHEPERRLVFRFDPGLGLDGVHRFDLEPLGTDGTRLVHTLDAQVGGPLRLAAQPLLRMHDLVIEDLLDRAELATGGRPPRAAPLPRWMRAMNAVEKGLSRAGGSLSAARRSRPSSA